MSRLFTRVVVSLLLVLFWSAAAAAAITPVDPNYLDYIGFTQLSNELGGSPPTGAGVVVSQVEAGSTSNGTHYYLPFLTGTLDPEFTDKTISPTPTPAGVSNPHAIDVGIRFFGNNSSIAPGITSIKGYDADYWLQSAFLNTGDGQPLKSSARVANHSWVGAYGNAAGNVDALRRLDWVIHTDEYIQVVGMDNGIGIATRPLLGSSFNAIAVGLSSGASKHGSVALDDLYTAGRTRPDLVAPETKTSYATPFVSAAAALLVQVGHAGGTTLSTDPAEKFTYNRLNIVKNENDPTKEKIYNAERSEIVKAALMAGASRTAPQLVGGYHPTTTNGLDSTYGAGQLNIYNSYHIIAAGEQNSLQDAPGTHGYIGRYGFDYDPYFGGLSSSNRTASYYFRALADGKMTASLVWNLDVNASTLYHLGLYLYDLTDLVNPLAHADGTLDNTENLWTSLNANHNYLLQVSAVTTGNFWWDYGLAWDISTAVAPVPIPGALYLLGTGFLVLVGFRRKFMS